MPRESKENGRKRRYSDVLEDLYRGPQEFMEAGVRGFLVTSIPDREEHSIDETVKVLRKTCVKLYGGIKPLKREDASFAKGYVMVDFMDPEAVVSLPNPDAEKVVEEEKAKVAEEPAKEEGKENEEMEEENKQEEESKPEEGEAGADKPKAEGEAETETATEEGKDTKPKEKKKKEDTRRRRDDDKKPLMLAPHKFKGYRTELRHIMFIKSDIPDPVEVVNACFDLMLERKPLYTDCVNQLLPVQGVCDNDYKQLEIMCRRVLVPYIGEQLEEPPSFGVMLVNKMCEPGAEVLLEVVRSAIWCLNPCAWQCSPWAEPDVVIHVEIIGSKIILSAMPHYMKYRQYSPFALYELGRGKPEDEEQLLKEKSDDFRPRGSRGGRRKDKSGKNKDGQHKEHDKGGNKEGGEKEKTSKDPAESTGEKEQSEQTEKGKEEEQPTEEQPTEEQPAEAQPTTESEAATEEKKESSEKKTPSRTRKSKS